MLIYYTKRYLQSDCKHHILGDNVLCSKTCDKDNSQTQKTAKEKKTIKRYSNIQTWKKLSQEKVTSINLTK